VRGVCRSIRTLRPPYVDDVTQADVDAAALQYVRKIAGMRAPSARNAEAFDAAVRAVAAATADLLRDVQVRPARQALPPPPSPSSSSNQRSTASS
jgi:hypothetical protein